MCGGRGGLELHYLRAQTEGVKIHRNFVGYFVNLMTSLLSKIIKKFRFWFAAYIHLICSLAEFIRLILIKALYI